MSQGMPNWLATEDAVRRTFELLGFDVEQVSIHGRQIDAIARKSTQLSFHSEVWIVEITTERVNAIKGGTDSQKLLIAQKNYPGAHCLLISTAGFTDDQRTSLRALGIHPLTYTEFESSLIPLRRYASNALAQVERPFAPDIGYHKAQYVEPIIGISESAGRSHKVTGDEWIKQLLDVRTPSICAVLGDLGTGKTSLLQRALEFGCNNFLGDLDNAPLPIYLALGRYKQHSGDLEQMLMAEFRRAGIDTYPAALVRHLIDRRRLILLLDGLDEVHPIQNSDDVLGTVTHLLTSIGREAKAVISCRRQFFQGTAEELAYFGPYTAGRLQDIQLKLTRSLRGHSSTYIASLCPFDRPRINRYLKARCGMDEPEVDKFFSQFYGFEDMAQTPVLLSMMATAIDEQLIDPTQDEPFPLILLYEQYTNRWIERDRERAKLSSKERRQLSKAVAVYMMWSSRESETWSYLAETLKKEDAWRSTPLANEEAELDVRKSGFLIRDIDDRYRFIHRSIMEYFSAVVELERLESGERPRHMPTDGFRLFLAHLIAKSWFSAGKPPFQESSWNRPPNEPSINAQLSLLASATSILPRALRVELALRSNLVSNGRARWIRTNFFNMKWSHCGADIEFEDCALTDLTLTISDYIKPAFSNCRFDRTTIKFDRLPSWAESAWELGASQVRLEVPGFVWDLAALVTSGARVLIGEREWRLGLPKLVLCSVAMGRLKGKVQVDSFISGTYADDLRILLPKMISSEWIVRHGWRQPHQLEITKKALAIIGKLSTDPLDVQDEFELFSV